mmetsp:Transcript_33254/g.77530  ORF Transcript_33254/g.77530 Transcript_33254/m.77530 type:complete len:97 (+) Transcript_33254:79-369(+)
MPVGLVVKRQWFFAVQSKTKSVATGGYKKLECEAMATRKCMARFIPLSGSSFWVARSEWCYEDSVLGSDDLKSDICFLVNDRYSSLDCKVNFCIII